MDNKNKLRTKVQLIILTAVLTMFAITGIVYVVTLKQYVFNKKSGTVVTEEAKAEKQFTTKAPDKTEKPVIEIVTEDKQDTTHEKETIKKPENEIVEEPKEPTFKELNEIHYADEIAAAYRTYLSDTTYIAVMKDTVNGSPYCITHVIVNNPEQIKTIVTSDKQYARKLYDNNEYLFAMNASVLNNSHTTFIDGLHICDYNVISKMTITTGVELAYDNTGSLVKLNEGTPFDELKSNNIKWTVLSGNPTLIENSKAVELPADISTNVTCKSVIGMVAPGEYYFMVASDGDYLSNVTYADMQKILLDKSCTFAQSLSTGVNVVMSMQGELINQPAVGPGRPQYEYIVITD